jgi:hypothetical protein
MLRFAIWVLLSFGLLQQSAVPAGAQTSRPTAQLIEKVAHGDPVEVEDATRQLIAQLVDPLADSIGSMSRRSVPEQLRLRELVARLNSALRTRLVRDSLDPPDRELFDHFASAYPELTTQLFHDDWRARDEALQRIPLESSTGAGVMIAVKVDDTDEQVARDALEIARRFHDDALVRGLIRFVRTVLDAFQSHVYGPADRDIQIALTDFVRQAVEVLGEIHASEAAPVVIDTLKTLVSSPLKDFFPLGDIATVLGELNDPRARPVLEEMLDFPSLRRGWPAENGKYATQTTGDAALLSLVRIYHLDMNDFGLVPASGGGNYAGYVTAEARQAGHRAMRVWLAAHPFTESAPTGPGSQPQNLSSGGRE